MLLRVFLALSGVGLIAWGWYRWAYAEEHDRRMKERYGLPPMERFFAVGCFVLGSSVIVAALFAKFR